MELNNEQESNINNPLYIRTTLENQFKSINYMSQAFQKIHQPFNVFKEQLETITRPLREIQSQLNAITVPHSQIGQVVKINIPHLFNDELLKNIGNKIAKYQELVAEMDFFPEFFNEMPLQIISDPNFLDNTNSLQRRYLKETTLNEFLDNWIESLSHYQDCIHGDRLIQTLNHIKTCLQPLINESFKDNYSSISLATLLLAVHLQQIIQDAYLDDHNNPSHKNLLEKHKDSSFRYCKNFYFSNVKPFTESADQSRHGICHGKSINYGTIDNFVRYLFFIEFFVNFYTYQKKKAV